MKSKGLSPPGAPLFARLRTSASLTRTKVVLFLAAVVAAVALTPLNRLGATAGDLDLTFGAGGRVSTDFRVGVSDQAMGITLQPDGKINKCQSRLDLDWQTKRAL